MHARRRSFLIVLAAWVAGAALPAAQAPSQFQFVLSATDAAGTPVTDIAVADVAVSENNMPAKVLKVEPFSLPIKLTIAVDNGTDSREALPHFRAALKGLVEALPNGVEVTLITMAPQPRMLVRATTDRAEVLRGIDRFGPDDERARFSDTLSEYADRLEREVKDKKITLTTNYLPVLVMLSTTGAEAVNVQRDRLEKGIAFLIGRGARLFVAMTPSRAGDATATADLTTTRQALIAMPAAKATGGVFQPVPVASEVAKIMPDLGKMLGGLHTRQASQFLVTIERPAGMTGQLQNPRIEVTRTGLTGNVSLDGRLPR